MIMSAEEIKKIYIRVPFRPKRTKIQEVRRALEGCILSPVYWLLAYRDHVPGLYFRRYCALLFLKLFFKRKAQVPYVSLYQLLFWPMDSTRYLEFDFVWHALSNTGSIGRYLDVSSPRLLPLILLEKRHELTIELINPDTKDLTVTANLIKAAGFADRCNLHNCLIEAVPFAVQTFDVISSISVVEHIPQDTEAIQKMWDLLKPGGRLILSVPCAAEAIEQYRDSNDYGLLDTDKEGFVFFQRLYDDNLLQKRIFSITGKPVRYVIYGEKKAGSFSKNMESKLVDPDYPFWREPYMMGRDFAYFAAIADLPGEGVIAMEFIKE